MPESRIPKQLVELQRQIVEFQKTAFDSTWSAISALQDQQREMMSRLLESSPAPAELKQLIEEWGRALETGREQFRDSVDRSFETVESYLERIAGEAESGSGGAGVSAGSGAGRSSGGPGAKSSSKGKSTKTGGKE